MVKEYVGLKLTIVHYCETDVLTGSVGVEYEDGVAVNGSNLWSTTK